MSVLTLFGPGTVGGMGRAGQLQARRGGLVAMVATRLRLAVAVFFALAGGQAWAVNPPPSQVYYVPFPEDTQLTAFAAINAAATNPLAVFITFSTASDNTVIWYDQWEDGYEEDILSPVQSTTLIFGDGNPANGYPPGNPGDLIPAGTVFSLRNFVDTTTVLTVFDYDARDKIAASKSISVTKTTFPQSTQTLLAGCFEVYEYGLWGTEYRSPIGVDMATATDSDMFAYAALAVSAGPHGAQVQIDKDNNGVFEETVTLTEGQSLFRDTVNVGGRILSDMPVQVVLVAGRPGSNYQSRDTSLTPISRWSSSYYAPVSTPATGLGGTVSTTVVFLYNPGASAITVSYDYRSSTSAYTTATLSVPAGSYAKTGSLLSGAAYHFYTTGASPELFYAFCAVDGGSATVGNNQAWDGGFALIGQPSLSTQVLLSLGIGRDPYSTVNLTENGNPVYLTTVGNGHTPATIYVDYNGDNAGANTDPNGNHYDVSYSLRELDQQKLFDPDGDQSGMLVYSLSDTVKIAAAWAQDPALASASQPGVDVATIIPPLREGAAGKASIVVVDADGDGRCSAGDTLEYDLRVNNVSRAAIPGPFQIQDSLPVDTTYVPGTTKYRYSLGGSWMVWVPVPDDGTGTTFPLDVSGCSIPGSIAYGQSLQVVFQAVIAPYASLTPGTDRITNTGDVTVTPMGVQIPLEWTDLLYGSIGDRIWDDLNGNGILDGGESGLNGVIVYADLNNNNVRDANEPWTTTAGNGDYAINGLLAGTYTLRVNPASLAAIDPRYGPTYDLDGVATSYVATATLLAAQDRTDVDFGFRTGASVGDRVWVDRNANGVQESGEPGINSIRVYIDVDHNNVYDVGEPNSFTFDDGTYYIGNLTAGSYEVRVDTTTLPTGATQTYDLTVPTSDNEATVTLTTIHNALVDFGYRGTQSIGDLVWEDVDANGVNLNVIDGRVDINGSGGVDTSDDGFIGTMRVIDGYLDINGSGTISTADDGTFQGFTVVDGAIDINGSGGTPDANDDGNRVFLPDIAIVDGLVDINASGSGTTADDGYIGTMRVIDGRLDVNGSGTVDTSDDGTFQGYPVIDGYLDTNRSGTITAADDGTLYTDKPIAGVRVYLDSDNDGVFDATEASATTDVGGAYSIGNFFNGTYTVRVDTSTLPASYAQTYDLTAPSTDHTATVTLSGTSRADVDFGYRNDASIGDFIWNDRDNDGVQDAGEPGIAGVLVYLDANANSIFDAGERSALTDLNGTYLIDNLPAGTFLVRVEIGTLPVGSTQTYDLDGTGTADLASRTLTAHESATNVDFGYRSTASLGDRVWTDSDGDGVQDVGETGINGVRVYVDSNGNGAYDAATEPAATTATDGNYTITNLVAGTYTVRLDASTLPAGRVQTYDLTGALDHSATVALAANQTRTDVDFGYVAPVTLGDRVWSDLNANGQQDVGEPGLDGVTVTVYRTNGSIAATTSSSGGGAYTFATLLPGTYYVGFGTLPGYALTLADQGADASDSDANATSGYTASITLTAGQSNLTLDAGYAAAATLGNFVWIDTNGNGQQDVGETGLYGATVNLYRPGYGPDGIAGNADDADVIATTTSAANGAYSFTSLPAGSYILGFAAVPDYARTVADQGADSTDSDAQVSTGLTATLTLAYGDTNNTLDAGFYRPASLAGAVRVDVDGDGVIDAEDTVGLAGVTVLLLDASSTVVASTTTSNTGAYSFTNLAPGSYTAVQLLPTGYTNTVDVVPPNDRQIPRTLSSGQNSTGNDFYDKRDSTPTPQGKVLYLSDPSQALDRVDPAATPVDNTTATTATLATPSVVVDATSSTAKVPLAFDATSSTSGSSTSFTFSHTTGTGADRLLLVGVSMRAGAEHVNSVTYAGNSLTLVGAQSNGANTRMEIWRLVNPPTAANNVVVTLSASGRAVIGAATFTGVDQTTPLGTFASATGSSTTPSVAVSSAVGELVFDTVSNAAGQTSMTPGTNQTERWDVDSGGNSTSDVRGGGSTEAGAASVTMSWTAGDDDWAIGGVSIKPASVSFSHTTGSGSDRLLLVAVAVGGINSSSTAPTVTGVTYGGSSLTSVASQASSGTQVRSYIYSLLNPNSGAANVVVTLSGSGTVTVGATTFAGVDQTTPLGTAATAQGTSTTSTVNVTSATGQLVFGTTAFDGSPTLSLPGGSGQTLAWNQTISNPASTLAGAASTEPGAATVTHSYSSSASQPWSIVAAGIRQAATVTQAVFTQSPAFALPFAMASGASITVTNYVNVISGSMPANPTISAVLSVGGTPFLTLSSPSYSAGLLTWTGSLGGNVNIAAGQAIVLTVTTTQSGVAFQLRYDSSTYPSKIVLPTTSIIAVPAFDVYDAAYPNGSPLTDASITVLRYVRVRVTDPFGASDITSVGLVIDGPGTSGDVSPTLGASEVVASDSWSKTYEYVWHTIDLAGDYTLTATANEGTEGINATATITDHLYASAFGDRVWDDLDGDGVQDAGEPGIGGVRVYIDSNNNGSYTAGEPNATTAADGSYSIGNRAAGSYTVRVDTSTLPSGLTQTYDLNGGLDHSASVVLAVGQTRTDVDFGYRGAGSIGDRIFADVNNNGVWDAGEGISGVQVTLSGDMDGDGDTDTVVVTTGAEGLYTLSGLRATVGGVSYSVTVNPGNLPSGLTVNSVDPDGGGNSTATVALTNAAPTRLDQDFGYRSNASIAGQVRKDTDNDGNLADTEYPIVNVLVELRFDTNANGRYDTGEPLVATANTASDGRYAFSGFAFGKYVVVETDPTDYSSTNDLDGNANSNGFSQIAVNVVAATAYPGRDFLDRLPSMATVAVVSRLGVTLAEFGTVVRWETASEVGSVAFNLYRETAGDSGRIRVTAEPIPAVGEPQGGVYAVLDDAAIPGTTCRYWVEELPTFGAALFHGPFFLTLPLAAGASTEVAGDGVSPLRTPAPTRKGQTFSSASLVLGGSAHPADPDKAARAAERTEPALTNGLALSKTSVSAKASPSPALVLRSLTTHMKIPVTTEGMKYLSVAAIATGLGVAPEVVRYGIQYRQLQVTCEARTVGSVGAVGGEGLYFYARPPVSPYTKTNIYWLEQGLVPSLRAVDGRMPAPVSATSFLDVLHLEQDLVSLVSVVASPEDGLWAWGSLLPAAPVPSFRSRTVTTNLTQLGTRTGNAGVTVRLHGGSDSAAPADHLVEISLNGTVLGRSQWDGFTPHTVDLLFPATLLVPGNNTIKVGALLAGGVSSSTCYLDWIDLTYPRACKAVSNQLSFRADGNPVVTVIGFTDPAIQVFDITDPTRTLTLTNLTIGPAAVAGTYSVSLMPANPNNRYVAFVPAALATPTGTPVYPSALRALTTKIEHVIIAPTDMLAAAEVLAQHRRQNGLTSMVVNLTEVYDEFNFGLAEPTALRSFLTTAYNQWKTKPRYVVLIGDGTYDYCNIKGLNDNLLPPLLTHNPYGLFASDISLGDVRNDDGLPEIAVGRLPVMNASELSAVIAKIIGYETAAAGSSPLDLILSADTPDNGGDFPLDAEALAAATFAGSSLERVYLSELALADARSRFLQSMTGGTRFVNWLGHGGTDRLSRAGLLTSADVPSLTISNDHLALLVAASCVINRFEIPGYDSLGEVLVLKPNGGAIAVLAPSALAYNTASRSIDQKVFTALCSTTSPRLGDAVILALRGLVPPTTAPENEVDARRIYTLLGDPGLKLQKKRP